MNYSCVRPDAIAFRRKRIRPHSWVQHKRGAANKICICSTFDRNYKLGGKALFKSIRRYTDCAGIDFKVITADPEVVREFGAENCHVVTEEIKARYANVKYIPQLPAEKYAASWYRYEL